MDNKEIYKKTLTFSLRRFGWDLLSVVVIIILAAAGFFLAEKFANNGLMGLAIGVIVAIILVAIVSHFVSYIFKAGQIAMMTKGVTEGKLPDDVYAEGKKIVKERFLTVAAYYAATSAIRGIFNQLGRAITALGSAIGGDNGSAVGSAISSVIQTIVRYLCDCCLGWVFYMKDKSAVKATLEGAVLFFKHGKTFFKNMGRVFGMSFVSFLVIGGVFFGITYLITMAFPDAFNSIAAEFAKDGTEDTAFLADPNNVMLITAAIGGIVMWSILHSVFVRPFILVGVLRNFIESGKNETISEKDLDELDGKSAKFKKLHEEAKA